MQRPFLRVIALLLVLSAPTTAGARVEDDTNLKIAQIKAAYVLNFLKYTQWPEESFADKDSPAPIVLVVLGDDALMHRVLKRMLAKGRAGERRIRVVIEDCPTPPGQPGSSAEHDAYESRLQETTDRIRKAHAVFVCSAGADNSMAVLASLKNAPVLTLGDSTDFAKRGGMLGLALRENRVAFDANPTRIRKAGLQLSARVLRLARIVDAKGGGKR